MRRSNFVKPDIVRLPLSGDDYIEIKNCLTAGEQRRVFARVAKDVTPGEAIKYDLEKVGLTKMSEYIVGWGGPGFVDDDGQPVEVSELNLNLLFPDKYAEIVAAVEAHEAAQERLREAEKNAMGGGTKSEPISSSAA